MSTIDSIPTSELIFASVYPDVRVIKSRKPLDDVIYKRIIKKFGFSYESAKKMVELEKYKIQKKGCELSDYAFFQGKTLDELLVLFLDSIDKFSRAISYDNNLGEFTFSELVTFRAILLSLYANYKKRSDEYEHQRIQYDKEMDKATRSNLHVVEVDDIFQRISMQKNDLKNTVDVESEYQHFWSYLSKLCYSKICYDYDFDKTSLKTNLKLAKESFRVLDSNIPLCSEISLYKKLEYDVASHDKKILSRYDVSCFITK